MTICGDNLATLAALYIAGLLLTFGFGCLITYELLTWPKKKGDKP